MSDTTGSTAAYLRGAIDIDCRSALSVPPRTMDHREAMDDAIEAGLAAVVFMDDHHPTTPAIRTLRETAFADAPLLPVSGVVLNGEVGGLNPYAAEHDLMLGGRIISMPTHSAVNHVRQFHRTTDSAGKGTPAEALSVLDARGRTIDPVREILDFVARYDAVLAGGHLHIAEILPLFAAAREAGVKRFLVTQPARFNNAGMDDIRELAEAGVFIAASADETLPDYAGAAGTGQLIALFGTDDRQNDAGPAARGRQTVQHCLSLGFSEADMHKLLSANAARLLGLKETD